ncbi:ATP-dependent helicase [Carbonactinospora thermoautotrophica]|uniref:ATP-dependent DNA helicase n=1 Tax=Carbonactinospora thermoautotrophica TaxID=1469144 RepID=UPI00226DF2E1|nr:ATP-dependent DNA helicase [Carbonactinospora thermoautotrophica]MCX9191237.1 ATP-dependent helicase [Carbonactinospora thermoautotrophica]
MNPPSVRDLLRAAVAAVGGSERAGQVQMAEAVADALESGEHLLVQAGTGTGKSLAYLVPALRSGKRVVIATATLALQRQLVERDLPRTVKALAPLLGREPGYATLKGRHNYLCLHRVFEGPLDDQGALFEALSTTLSTTQPATQLGRDVLRLREWAQDTETGDRDDLSPGVGDRAWGQVSVSARECLGAARCPYGDDCFAELAREQARLADIVVTNHALLALDAIGGVSVLPEHDVVVVDEAHELVSRVTTAATAELGPGPAERAVQRCARLVDEAVVDGFQAAVEDFVAALHTARPGRITQLDAAADGALGKALWALRDAARRVISELSGAGGVTEEDAARRQALAGVESIFETAGRVLAESEHDVAWIEPSDRYGPVLRVAPLLVSGLLRDKLFSVGRTVVITSATLKLGGDFDTVARSIGLHPAGRLDRPRPVAGSPAGTHVGDRASDGQPGAGTAGEADPEEDQDLPLWRAIDVGSPFDYRRQGILYVARHLPAPGRDGMHPAVLDELAELMQAAGGRTLGLFSSMRAARAAAEALRGRLDLPIACQGEDSLPELLRRFTGDARTCLFGTLSLWQGVDVPGPACQLVVIDRIPFPRPDDPLMSARQQEVDARGGNGFLAVAASHAALLLAQGAGRLIRSTSDRGVVAVLDSRLATARYAGFLRSSLPDFWYTTDPVRVRRSLAAIDASAPPVG